MTITTSVWNSARSRACRWVATVLPLLVLTAGLGAVAVTAVSVAGPKASAWASTGSSQYVPVTETRICDTRAGERVGPVGGGGPMQRDQQCW